jgi:hypothetical protein
MSSRLIHTASPLIQGPRGVIANTFLLVHMEGGLTKLKGALFANFELSFAYRPPF